MSCPQAFIATSSRMPKLSRDRTDNKWESEYVRGKHLNGIIGDAG